MKCPHCSIQISFDSAECSRCGYDLEDARDRFGVHSFAFRRLIHSVQCLTEEDKQQLLWLLKHLEKQFPQVLFGIFFVSLEEDTNVNELGFWMLNHCKTAEGDKRQAENGAFLIVDVASRSVGFALGYRLERIFPEADLHRCLRTGEMHFCESDFGEGAYRTMRKFGQLLAKHAKVNTRVPKRWINNPPSSNFPGPNSPAAVPGMLWGGAGMRSAFKVNPKSI